MSIDFVPRTDDERRVLESIKTVYDPEIPVNIVELGLVYEVTVSEAKAAHVRMTLTAPGCPVADDILRQVKEAAEATEGVESATVELVFDPPWDREKMSEVAKFELGFEV